MSITKLSQAIIIFVCLVICSCSSRPNSSTLSNIDSVEKQDTKSDLERFGIVGSEIIIRTGPGEKFQGVINEKASSSLGSTEYCQVDHSVKVEIMETQKNWVKIKVVEPAWLSDSHIGWIPSKYIVTQKEQQAQELSRIATQDYEILTIENRASVQNFHVWLKRKKFDKNYVYQFAKAFKKEHCTKNCNIDIYDTGDIKSLIGIYPLKGKAYLKMADHLVSFSSFDATEVRDWYPFQDFHYKELGGKNWKKDKIN